jgi:hypothetical protein
VSGKTSANKTGPTTSSVDAFLAGVTPPSRAADARVLIPLFTRLTGEPAVMWGPSIIGFGTHRYRYESGREGETPRAAFAPRKAALVMYLHRNFPGAERHLERLGRFTTGKGCLYVKRLADIDLSVLEALVAEALTHLGD